MDSSFLFRILCDRYVECLETKTVCENYNIAYLQNTYVESIN